MIGWRYLFWLPFCLGMSADAQPAREASPEILSSSNSSNAGEVAETIAQELDYRCRLLAERYDLETVVERLTISNLERRFNEIEQKILSPADNSFDQLYRTPVAEEEAVQSSRKMIDHSCERIFMRISQNGPSNDELDGVETSRGLQHNKSAHPTEQKCLFPWPPPAATSGISKGYNEFLKQFSNLGSFDTWLKQQLQTAHYSAYRYWCVPGGFAVATELESIANDAQRVDNITGRHSQEGGWSVVNYLVDLISKPADRARVFLFILTNDPQAGDAKADVTTGMARNWIMGGDWGLSPEASSRPIDPKDVLLILVYEFKTMNGRSEPKLVEEGKGLSIYTHLQASGIRLARSN